MGKFRNGESWTNDNAEREEVRRKRRLRERGKACKKKLDEVKSCWNEKCWKRKPTLTLNPSSNGLSLLVSLCLHVVQYQSILELFMHEYHMGDYRI